jgi:hypothetical protein
VSVDLMPIPATNVLRVIVKDGKRFVACQKHGLIVFDVDAAAAAAIADRHPPCPHCIAEMFD